MTKFTDEELQKLNDLSDKEAADILGVNVTSVWRRRNKGFKIKSVSQYTDGDGKVLRQWVKTEEENKDYMLEAFKSMIDKLPNYPLFKPSKNIDYQDTLSVFPLGDPHIGMLSWAAESGENWNLKIAEDVFRKMFDVIISKAPPSKIAMLEILGDTLHYDNIAGMTARSGNILDTDGRYPEMVRSCVNIVLNMINSLLNYHETVIVDIVRGNHDDVGSIWLAELIQKVYGKNPRVQLLDQHGPIHIYEFGKVLIASHHGHTMKMEKLPITIASDYPEAWGRTSHRYCLTGHIHHDSKQKAMGKEFTGMWVESFRTLAAKDSYAAWGGWRSKRDTKAIVYHKELGEIERYTASVDSLMLQID